MRFLKNAVIPQFIFYRMMKYSFPLNSLLRVCLFGIVGITGSVHASAAAPVRVERDVAYLGSERTEKMDVYLPPESFQRPLPAVLVIHGGGWAGGDKANAREVNIGQTLAAHGYAVFSINYLLNKREKDPATGRMRTTEIAWPQNLYDCKSALRFIRAEAERFGVDPDRIAVQGGSAGGHLAMLVGATAHNKELNAHGLYTDESNAVSAILTFYGDYDIRGRRVSPFAGSTPEETKANEELASPITHFDANTPPVFVTHGTADGTVSVERSRMLVAHLKKLGIEHEYVEIPGAPHTYHLQPAQMDLRPAVLDFLKKHLPPRS